MFGIKANNREQGAMSKEKRGKRKGKSGRCLHGFSFLFYISLPCKYTKRSLLKQTNRRKKALIPWYLCRLRL
jgi:hypothetical protein